MANPKKPAKNKAKPGPMAEVLKQEGDRKDNIRKSMQTAKSAKG
jgi:hypothetical protein